MEGIKEVTVISFYETVSNHIALEEGKGQNSVPFPI